MESPHRADLFDPAALATLGHIEVVARWIVDGFLSGLHRSPRKGFSVEFADFRPYQPGDDLRYVDWKIAARADRWVVKQYEEETNLRATLVLDVSRSMEWKGDAARLTKRVYAEQLVAAMALLLLRQRDAVGLIRFDDAVRTSVPPRARTTQWRRIVARARRAGRWPRLRSRDRARAGSAARHATRHGDSRQRSARRSAAPCSRRSVVCAPRAMTSSSSTSWIRASATSA